MRGAPRVDASRIQLGAATKPVRSMLAMLNEIDWFVPPDSGSIATAVALFDRYWALLEPWADDTMYPRRALELDVEFGGLDQFRAMCANVRRPNAYDWRYGPPKLAERIHGIVHGFDEQDLLPFAAPNIAPNAALFIALNGSCIWRTPAPELRLPRDDTDGNARDVRQWFLNSASVDVMHGVRWQFVEPHASLGCNPFATLLECYARGGYPIVLAPARVCLFFFDR